MKRLFNSCMVGIMSGLIFTASLTAQWQLPPTDVTPEGVAEFGQVFDAGIDRFGDELAVWIYRDDAATKSSIHFASFDSASQKWSDSSEIVSGSLELKGMKLSLNSEGNGLLVWEDAQGVFASYYQKSLKSFVSIAILAKGATSPDVGIDEVNDGIAIWEDSKKGIRGAKYEGISGVWHFFNEALPGSSAHSAKPSLSVNGLGDAIAVWKEGSEEKSHIEAARFDKSWGLWRGYLNLSSKGSISSAKIFLNENSQATASWIIDKGHHSKLQCAVLTWLGWSDPKDVSLSQCEVFQPTLIMDRFGNSFFSWSETQSSDGSTQVVARKYDLLSGEFLPATILSSLPSAQSSLSVDSDGNLLAVWIESLNSESRVVSSYYNGQTNKWKLPAYPICQANQSVELPTVVMNGKGKAVAIWRTLTDFTGGTSLLQAAQWFNDQPLPPTDFMGRVVTKSRFLSKRYYLVSSWSPSPSPNILQYCIYQGDELVQTVGVKGPFTFETKLTSKKGPFNYFVTAVNQNLIESDRVAITIE